MPIGIDPETVKDKHCVLFVRPDREESSAIFVRTIPRQGEIVWVNFRCYEVDKVATYFIASDSGGNGGSVVIFLKEPDFDPGRYEQPDPYKVNREDSMNGLA